MDIPIDRLGIMVVVVLIVLLRIVDIVIMKEMSIIQGIITEMLILNIIMVELDTEKELLVHQI